MINDLINGLFEAGGTVAVFLHCRELIKAKRYEGVSVLGTLFFTSWGYWNIWFYANLDQWFSWAAGICLALANTFWVVLLWKYRNG